MSPIESKKQKIRNLVNMVREERLEELGLFNLKKRSLLGGFHNSLQLHKGLL